MPPFKSVLITGASSGIGAALAAACAAPDVRLHLSGRDPARLEAVAAGCRTAGAQVETTILDVTDAAAMASWIAGAGTLDLVIANAGIGAGVDGGGPETAAQVRAVFATNLDGMLNTVLPAMAAMAAQPEDAAGLRGRIAVIASIAAFVPAPGAPSYCASKAAADSFTVATAVSAARIGVQLTSVCPGYIRTAMTADNPFPMPGLMDAPEAAALILRAIAAGRRRLVFPWWMGLAARLVGLLPPRLLGAMLSGTRGKPPLRDGGPTPE
jgi:NAD(P)-dependent dehydrogenase (short-subunit alcohol dehydrogenase family)